MSEQEAEAIFNHGGRLSLTMWEDYSDWALSKLWREVALT